MSDKNPSTTDQILDLLLDALQARQQSREGNQPSLPVETKPSVAPEPIAAASNPEADLIADEDDFASFVPADPESNSLTAIAQIMQQDRDADTSITTTPETDVEKTHMPQKLPSIHLEGMLSKLVIVLFLLLIVVNIPFNRFGTSLARAMPDTASLVVRDGLVIKGSGEEIYVIENNQKRWISTLDAFQYYGYRWEQVNQVDDAFLARFENGRPVYLLLKCNSSPHVYALENGEKRWVKDIPTFTEYGFVWEDIKFVSCTNLRDLPDGLPIPPDAGEPPQP